MKQVELFEDPESEFVRVTIGEKSARLEFQGCHPDYIKDVCGGRCCWTIGRDGKTTTTIYAEPDQRPGIIAAGGSFRADGVLETTEAGKCSFQGETGLCTLHGRTTEDGIELKPRSCFVSPWILSKNNKLIIRNRYRLLRCFKAEPRFPAYIAFNSGLRMLFGDAVTQSIVDHFENGGGDLDVNMPRNRHDLIRHVMGEWHTRYYGEDLTRVEVRGEYLLKRDDEAEEGKGAKARYIRKFLEENKPDRVVTVGSRTSVQIMVAARVCRDAGIPLSVFVPSGAETVETETAERFGAEVVRISPGYLSVLRKRADDFAEETGAALIPFALEDEKAVELIAEQAANVPDGVRRILVCAGSGITAAGILRGTAGKDITVLAIEVGMLVDRVVKKYAETEIHRLDVLRHPFKYEKPGTMLSVNGLALDPYYEAKAAEYIKPGDLFWITANRSGILSDTEKKEIDVNG